MPEWLIFGNISIPILPGGISLEKTNNYYKRRLFRLKLDDQVIWWCRFKELLSKRGQTTSYLKSGSISGNPKGYSKLLRFVKIFEADSLDVCDDELN